MADEFGKKVEAFGQNIWQKAQKTIDIVGINNDIGIKERRLAQLYADIGEAYCKAHLSDAQAEFPDLCGEAFALTKEIASLQASILRIKGFRECPACHRTVDGDAAYCPRCGVAMPAPEPPEEPDEPDEPDEPAPEEPDDPHCGQCGAELDGDAHFCHNCGAKHE